MAFNWQTFKTRTLTAAVFVIVMLVGLFFNNWSFFILFSTIHFGCWWEYLRLVGRIDKQYQKINSFHKYGLMIIGWCGMLYFFVNNNFYFENFDMIAAIVGLALLLLLPLLLASAKNPKNILYSFLGLLYISLPLALIMNMSVNVVAAWHVEPPRAAVFFLMVPFAVLVIACMWINDTMAYIIGSLIGKTPLTKISPKKTWEGTIGGVVLCIATVGLLLQYVIRLPGDAKIDSFHYYILPGIASIAGVFGDILESKLKRMAGLKDSGHIMPGHGGFLDRFDSLLVATPFVWLYVYLFMR
jgi:phosphatidate cytidylyltransferase